MDSLTIIIRLSVALLLGLLVGWQREYIGKSAGARTYALVAMGSALFTILSVNFDDASPSRIASNILVGIGFIGAGSIIHQKEHTVGLTTAAGLWVVSAMGMAVGVGWLGVGLFTAIITLAAFYLAILLRRFEPKN